MRTGTSIYQPHEAALGERPGHVGVPNVLEKNLRWTAPLFLALLGFLLAGQSINAEHAINTTEHLWVAGADADMGTEGCAEISRS